MKNDDEDKNIFKYLNFAQFFVQLNSCRLFSSLSYQLFRGKEMLPLDRSFAAFNRISFTFRISPRLPTAYPFTVEVTVKTS